MKKEYEIVSPERDVNNILRGAREDELAIGIMDTSTREDLENAILWYLHSFNRAIHVVTQQDRFTREEMSTRYSDVTFIVFPRVPSMADMLNALASTCVTRLFFATRSEASLYEIDLDVIRRKFASEEHPAVLCPVFYNRQRDLMPSLRMPKMLDKDTVDPQTAWPAKGSDSATLYPFMGMGIYDRALFQRLRGYDKGLSKPYWQAMDFGTKCWMYGYPVSIVSGFSCVFETKQFIVEDRTETPDICRFYTRSLSVRFKRGRAAFRHPRKFDRRVFIEEVKPKRSLFRTDYDTLCRNWKAQ